jgi:TolB protein
MRPLTQALSLVLALFAGMSATPVLAQTSTGPLRIEITEGVIEPMPFAVPAFVAETTSAQSLSEELAAVVIADLVGTGLFREIPRSAQISGITNFDSPVQFSDWKAVNAQALVTGAVATAGDQLVVKFRLFDVFSQAPLGEGLQFVGTTQDWRRMGHKVADAVYSRLTGESAYFDSRVVFVSETGPKNARAKRLAIMDYDGANVQNLTDDRSIVLAPRFSPDATKVLYTSYETGSPSAFILDLATMQRKVLSQLPGMTFAPRFSPDGGSVVLSLSDGGNTDIYRLELASQRLTRLTSDASIETAPSFSPDGQQIVFESDRAGTQQIYVMPVNGGVARRISFGEGRYGTPVWSPRGDLVAFTKINKGRFHIGVIKVDGSEERLLTSSFLDEGPTWSPNGRVLMFFRETPGASGAPSLYSVDITGRNLKKVSAAGFGSDPSWSRLNQ